MLSRFGMGGVVSFSIDSSIRGNSISLRNSCAVDDDLSL